MNSAKTIPKEWKKVKLGDVVKFRNGKAHEGEIKETGKYIVVNSKFVSTDGNIKKYSDSNLAPLLTGDIALVMSDIPNGRAIGKCFLVSEDNKYTLNQRICAIRPIQGSSQYFYQMLNRNKYFLSFDNGVGQTNLRKKEVLDCPLILPPLPEQNKISEILSTVDENIEKTDHIIKKTEKLKKGLMQELLTKGKVFKLDDISNIKRGASPRPIGDQKYFSDQGRGWIRISDVTKTYKYLNRTSQYLSKLGESLSVKVDKGDLIMSICATVGKPIIVNIPACIHDGFVFFKDLDSKKVDKECLFYALLKNEQNIQSKGQTGSQKNLNTTIVGNTQIQLPGVEEQKQTAEILSEVDNKIDINKQIKNKLTELKRGLMQDLLSGRVRVKNPAIKWQG